MSKKQMETTLINQYIHFSKPLLLSVPVRPWQSLLWWPQGKASMGAVLPRETKAKHPSKALNGCCKQTRSFFLGKHNTWMIYSNFFWFFFFLSHLKDKRCISPGALGSALHTPR